MTNGPNYGVGDEVVVCLHGSIYDGLGGTVAEFGKWWDGTSGAVWVDTPEGRHPFGKRALRPLNPN